MLDTAFVGRGLPAITKRILRWDSCLEPNQDDMQFRLTYAGQLLAHRDDERLPGRKLHVHDIRREFHRQLKKLWRDHPVLANRQFAKSPEVGPGPIQFFNREGFRFLPIVTSDPVNGLTCALDILMLRGGACATCSPTT